MDGEALDAPERGFVVVANSRQYGARFNPVPGADMADGLLDLAFFPCRTRRELIGWARRCHAGRQVSDPRLVQRRGREIEITSTAPVRFQLDGDPLNPAHRGDFAESAAEGMITKLVVRIRPRALPVLLPPDGSRDG